MRRVRSTKLETRSARLRLPVRRKPYYVKLVRGISLGYRRTKSTGTWLLRVAKDGQDWTTRVGVADDYADANGQEILTFDEAQERAWSAAMGGKPTGDNTVAAALERYEEHLKARGGDVRNVRRVRIHLPQKLAGKSVTALQAADLTKFRDGIAAKVTSTTVDRTTRMLSAALNLAADSDERITRRPWKTALKAVAGPTEARNVILDEADVRTLIGAAYRDSEEFAELVELMAVTGARPSQLTRLQGEDVQADWTDPRTHKRRPRIMMPVSHKGRGVKPITHRPVAITEALAERLKGRTGLLLKRADGKPWTELAHYFAGATEGVKFNNPAKVTLYALRHTSIVRQLLANVPIRVVAAHHDTSVPMIERSYSKYIGDHSDDLVRETLLETVAEVVPIASKRS
jgi:integrase